MDEEQFHIVFLWGIKTHRYTVAKLLRSFKAKKNKLPKVVQPLQALAYEAALLAGEEIDDDSSFLLAKQSLMAIPSFECKYDVASEEELEEALSKDPEAKKCHCDECLHFSLGYNDYFDDNTAFIHEHEIMVGLNFRKEWRRIYDYYSKRDMNKLTDELMEQVLGKKLASRVRLRFGTIISEGEDIGFWDIDAVFLYLSSHGFGDRGCGTTPFVRDMSSDVIDEAPTAFELWAFAKAIKLLRLNEDPFPCKNDEPKRYVSCWVDPNFDRY